MASVCSFATSVATSGLSDSAALSLRAIDKLRFVPLSSFSGTPGGLTVRLIETGGSGIVAGARMNVSSNGAATVISAATVPLGTSISGNRAPTDIALTTAVIAENLPIGTVVGTLSTTDPDAGDTFKYTIVGNGTGSPAYFSIDGNKLKTAAILDYETRSSFLPRIRSTDSLGLFTEKDLTISVTNVNEAPTITSSAAVSVAENQAAVQTVVAADPDAGTTLSYSIVGGADQALFAIDTSTGVLSFNSAPNYESPADSGVNNVYDLVVKVSDGSLTATKAVAVSVTNVNESPTDVVISGKSVAENLPAGTVVGTLSTIRMRATHLPTRS